MNERRLFEQEWAWFNAYVRDKPQVPSEDASPVDDPAPNWSQNFARTYLLFIDLWKDFYITRLHFSKYVIFTILYSLYPWHHLYSRHIIYLSLSVLESTTILLHFVWILVQYLNIYSSLVYYYLKYFDAFVVPYFSFSMF